MHNALGCQHSTIYWNQTLKWEWISRKAQHLGGETESWTDKSRPSENLTRWLKFESERSTYFIYDFAYYICMTTEWILFNSSRRRQFSNPKLPPSFLNSASLDPSKYLAHSGTKNPLNSSFLTTRGMKDSNFQTGQGYRFWSSSEMFSLKDFSIWLKRGVRWSSEARAMCLKHGLAFFPKMVEAVSYMRTSGSHKLILLTFSNFHDQDYTLKSDIFISPNTPTNDVLSFVQAQLVLQHLISFAVYSIFLRTFWIINGTKLSIPNGQVILSPEGALHFKRPLKVGKLSWRTLLTTKAGKSIFAVVM